MFDNFVEVMILSEVIPTSISALLREVLFAWEPKIKA
jgi:hypothetical protein